MGVIQRQGIKNFVSTYVGFLIGFVNLIIIQPRFLSPEELGLTRLLYSFCLLLASFAPIGIGNATTRFFPVFRNEEKSHHGFLPFLIGYVLAGYAFTASLVYLLKDFIMNQYRTESPLFNEFFDYVFPLVFVLSFIGVLNIYCNVNYKSTVPGYLNDIFSRIASIVIITLYYNKVLTLDGFILSFVGIYAVQHIMLLGYIGFFDRITLKIDWDIFREKKVFLLIRYGLLLWFAAVASLGLKYFDTVMLGKFRELDFVAIYAIASFIPTLIEAPANALEKIASPKIATAWVHNNMDELKAIYYKSSLYMTVLGCILFLFVNCNIKELMTFLPEGYDKGIYVVYIISFGTLINMSTGMNMAVIFNSNRYYYGAILLIVLAAFIIGLQYILIPEYGIEGAALSTCITSILYNSLVYYWVYRFYRLQPIKKNTLKVLLVTAVIFLLIWFIPIPGHPVFVIALRSLVIMVVYVGVIYRLNIIPEFHHLLERFIKRGK